jgi:hypothetical protein
VLGPTKVPGPLTMLAVAVCVPGSIVPPGALIVIVSTWFVFTAFVSVGGVIRMFAVCQILLALSLPPAAVFAAVFVVRRTFWPLTGMFEVAETTVVPATAEVIVTVQLAVAAPPVYVQVLTSPTKEPGPLTMLAVAVCVPASIVPLIAFTVIVSTWFVPTGFVSSAGVIWMFAFTHVLLALPLPPAAVFTAVLVARVIDWPLTWKAEVAETTVVPAMADVIVTVQLAVAAPPV